MCILFMYHGIVSSNYKLVIASNRDEYFARPTLPACFHFQNQILCGQDLQQGDGGTWLGINRKGKFAALTNYLVEKEEKTKKSRGGIVKGYLTGTQSHMAYIEAAKCIDYRAYNIIAGQINSPHEEVEASYDSNKINAPIQKLSPGFNTLASTSLNNQWNKVERGNTIFQNIIEKHLNDSEDSFINMLLQDLLSDNTNLYPDNLVLEQSKTRMPDDFLEKYCSIQVTDWPIYGTGVQTVVLVDRKNMVTYAERTLDINAVKVSTYNKWNNINMFKFKIE